MNDAPTFTPGPWRISDDPTDGDYEIEASTDHLPTGRVTICERAWSHSDAHLIAAAPDLYQQLKTVRGLVEKWCHYQGNTGELFREHLCPIDDALAKAEGTK